LSLHRHTYGQTKLSLLFSSCFQGSLASRIAEWNLLDFTVRHIRKCLGKEAAADDTEMKEVN
jgi:hypothetical protein